MVWKKAPQPKPDPAELEAEAAAQEAAQQAADAQSQAGAALDLPFGMDINAWGIEGWSHVILAGVHVPVLALAAPLPVLTMYWLFRRMSVARNARRISPAPDHAGSR